MDIASEEEGSLGLSPSPGKPHSVPNRPPFDETGRAASGDRVIPCDAITPRQSPSPSSGRHDASQRLGDVIIPPRARGKTRSGPGTRRLKMKRGGSPLHRRGEPIEQHKFVP